MYLRLVTLQSTTKGPWIDKISRYALKVLELSADADNARPLCSNRSRNTHAEAAPRPSALARRMKRRRISSASP